MDSLRSDVGATTICGIAMNRVGKLPASAKKPNEAGHSAVVTSGNAVRKNPVLVEIIETRLKRPVVPPADREEAACAATMPAGVGVASLGVSMRRAGTCAIKAPVGGVIKPKEYMMRRSVVEKKLDSWRGLLGWLLVSAGVLGVDLKPMSTPWIDTIEAVPFSFVYDGQSSSQILETWTKETSAARPAAARNSSEPASLRCEATTWTDPKTGLRVCWEVTRFADFPAVEWLLTFENTGSADTPIIEDIASLDVSLNTPLDDRGTYRLHRTNGAPSNPTDFEVRTVAVTPGRAETMGGGGGRSSNKDFPFFKIETGAGSLIVAVGWSGQWTARVSSPQVPSLHIRAGIEKTHFKLLPGEKVRMPRMLMLHWEGDTRESNAQFRQLIYKHYAAMKAGKKPLPTLFCNTCFTRGGGWLNECNAENQISLIKAYAPLGLEALLTDAGWFTGGWPNGAGNWDPRKDAYPDGMGPVAAAAKAHNMIYGLWFEPERVVAGTSLHKQHPDWVLSAGEANPKTFLADFGRKEVQDYFFNIVKGFMELPGFRVYRQDFNMDPLAYWRHNDAPDRQGITEIKYIEGLYAYWDRIADTWPDSLREECASGGRRIDLETVMRMHIHQDSDYWFDNDVDQAQIWGLSQYLPNNVFVGHINRMDDYSFHSVMASSLCMGWIADAPGFDKARGKKLLDRYLALRHLLIGSWYPLLPYSRAGNEWIASQYHRPDLDEGMILAFRRADSAYRTAEVSLGGLKTDAVYELTSEATGRKVRVKGADLMKQYQLTIPQKHRSEVITYREVR